MFFIATSPAPPQVANYIFGNNLGKGAGASEKIAMTSPVASKQQESDFRSMKGGDGEKIAMTSPVGTDMQGSKCAAHTWLHCLHDSAAATTGSGTLPCSVLYPALVSPAINTMQLFVWQRSAVGWLTTSWFV